MNFSPNSRCRSLSRVRLLNWDPATFILRFLSFTKVDPGNRSVFPEYFTRVQLFSWPRVGTGLGLGAGQFTRVLWPLHQQKSSCPIYKVLYVQ